MNIKKYFVILVAGMVLMLSSCNDYLDINKNPNNPDVVEAALLLAPIQNQYTLGIQFDGRFIGRYVQNFQATGSGDRWDLHGYLPASDAGGELWAVNTRFSCLCTFDRVHSFVPRWRPPFVTGYSPDDRCHLNGLGMADGVPRSVTALGATDAAGGWRADKARGGVLMDVPSGEVAAGGLSMPHSPRWHGGTLYVLESGVGSLATVDLGTGRLTPVAVLPGFTRGLDFAGPYAFVGLSQVRETAVFSGVPVTDRLSPAERCCGLWVVDLRTGGVAAFLRFEAGVQEVFGVTVLPHRWPELLTDESGEAVASSYVLPAAALAECPRGPDEPVQPP